MTVDGDFTYRGPTVGATSSEAESTRQEARPCKKTTITDVSFPEGQTPILPVLYIICHVEVPLLWLQGSILWYLNGLLGGVSPHSFIVRACVSAPHVSSHSPFCSKPYEWREVKVGGALQSQADHLDTMVCPMYS